MNKKPLVIFDSAHNEAGLRSLTAPLKTIPYKNLHFVYGTVGDKDITEILSLLPKKATYYFCKPNIPRGKDVHELNREAMAHRLKGATFATVKKAYQAALAAATVEDLVIVSGSIFVVAELI